MSRRRAPGEGSIYRRADGLWVGSLTVGYSGGRRQRKVIYGQTKRDVQARLKPLQEDAATGLPVHSQSPQLKEYMRDWLDAIRPGLRPKTFASYEGVTRLHILPMIGDIRLERLAVGDVARLLQLKQHQGLSPRSVRYIGHVLRNALNKAVRWGIVGRNVASLADLPREVHKDVRVLSPDEARRLVEAARGDRLEALWILSVSTGLRLGEVLALRWNDVDLNRRELRVTKALQRQTGRGLVVTEPKTRRSRRTIIIPILVAERLRRHQAQQELDFQAAQAPYGEDGLIFTSTSGAALDSSNVARSFKRLLQRAELSSIRFHDLRHSCASLLLAQGVSPRVVMETLGHSRISVTMDTYTHVMPALQRDAADAMDRALSPERGGQLLP